MIGLAAQISAVIAAAKKMERLHEGSGEGSGDKLVTEGIPPSDLVHLWEGALELRRLHHKLRSSVPAAP